MRRGTTPTLTFTLPFKCSNITKLCVAFSQDNKLLLEKHLSDCNLEDDKISVTLSEEDTLLFDCKYKLECQVRCACGDDKLASNIFEIEVDRILKDGCLE